MSKGYMFYDDETANSQQFICELAYTLTDSEGKQIGEPINQRINPETEFGYWNTKTHHITAEDVRDCPTLEQFCHDSTFLQDLTDYVIVAHHAKGSDIHHIEKSLSRYGIPLPEVSFIDTLEMACEILPPGKRSLARVCEYYRIPFKESHEALEDANACKEIYFKMVADGIESLPNVIDLTSLNSTTRTRRAHRRAAPVLGQGTLHKSTKTVDEAIEEVESMGLRGDLKDINHIEGLTIILSGRVPGYKKRDILEEELEHRGATAVDGYVPASGADLLVIGHNASQKRIDDSVAQGIPVITVGELLEAIDAIDSNNKDASGASTNIVFSDSDVITGKSFSFASGLLTLDPFEGYQIVSKRGGIARQIKSNTSVTADTDYFVVPDGFAQGAKSAVYIDSARAKGIKVISESRFWKLVDLQLAPTGVADHWVIVDDSLVGGKVDVSNQPAWDGSVAPYKLFIQRGTAKSTHAGGWKVIACGFLDDSETEWSPYYGKAICVKKDATHWTHFGWPCRELIAEIREAWEKHGPIPKCPRPSDALGCKYANDWPCGKGTYFGIGADIGKVIVRDRYAPKSCKYLFDGLQRCTEFDLSGLDTSDATDMRGMFRGCSSVKYFMTTDRFVTSQVTDMSEMFFGCINAQVINCIGWDLSNVKSMYMMFENSPAAVLFDDKNIPLPERINTARMFDTMPKRGCWLKRN